MRIDTFSKSLLGIIALSLVFLAGENFRDHITTVYAAPVAVARPQWEYKVISRVFRWQDGQVSGLSWWGEDGKELPVSGGDASAGLQERIRQLGLEGWELVAAPVYSQSYERINYVAKGNIEVAGSLNGMSTSDKWIFKRIK